MTTQTSLEPIPVTPKRRGHRRHGIPPIKCRATSQQSGVRCQKWSVPGSTVCEKHGAGAPQVQNAARVRLSIAELLDVDPQRPLAEVLRTAVHVADSAMGELLRTVANGDTSADVVGRLLDASKYAAGMAKAAMDAGLTDPDVPTPQDREQVGAQMVVALMLTMNEALDSLDIPPVVADQVRDWSGNALWARLTDREVPPVPVLPRAIASAQATTVTAALPIVAPRDRVAKALDELAAAVEAAYDARVLGASHDEIVALLTAMDTIDAHIRPEEATE